MEIEKYWKDWTKLFFGNVKYEFKVVKDLKFVLEFDFFFSSSSYDSL